MHTFGSHSLEKELFFHWHSPVWWPWSLELREKAMKRSLPCFSHHLKYSFLVPCTQYLKPLCPFQNDHLAIWQALLEWRDLPKEGFSSHPPGNEGVWIVSSSRGQDLHPRLAWYRIKALTTCTWGGLPAYAGFIALVPQILWANRALNAILGTSFKDLEST